MSTLGSDRPLDTYPISSAPPAWKTSTVVRRPPPPLPTLHIMLFAFTFVSTTMAGAGSGGADPLLRDMDSVWTGLPFAMTLMAILLFHESGHYFLAKVHGVPATLPYFIPAPGFPMGTLGAFIRMKSPPATRRALFDIGAAGPWAGLLVAIPAVLVGLRLSDVRPLGFDSGGLVLGDSILFSALTRLALGSTPSSVTIVLHPVALAGWFGLFVTALNLLPVGQLDGGHVVYALFGRWHSWISRLFLLAIAVLGYYGFSGWFVWIILLMIIGVDHPPTHDAQTPLSRRRRIGAWLTVVAFILTFTPVPFTITEASPIFEGERTPVAWHSRQPEYARGGLRLPSPSRPPRTRGVSL